jgi:hypothetical protein
LPNIKQLIERYPNLFPQSTKGIGEETQGNEFAKKWGWVATIDNLSNNDKTKWDYFLNLPIIQFLNLLSYHIDHSEEVRRAASEKSRL